MGLGFILLSLFVLNFSLSCWGDNVRDVTVTVKGLTTIAETDGTFICATLDWWPATECDDGMCPWGNTSLLNLDVDNPWIKNAVKEFQNLRIRIGGSLQDRVVYNVDPGYTICTEGFLVDPNDMFGYTTNCCLDLGKWDTLSTFFKNTGAMVTFGLNALYGRNKSTNPGDDLWTGPWDSSNARYFIQYNQLSDYPVVGWEFGNNLCADGVGARLEPWQYYEDMITLRNLVNELYGLSPIIPPILGPSCFYDQLWFDDYLERTDPNVVNIVSHHVYNLGPGDDPNLVQKMQDPFVLDGIAETFNNLQQSIKKYSPQSSAWVSESGGATKNGGEASHTFVDGFWYMDMLGRAAAFGHKVYCRQTLIGGNYGLLDISTILPNPDYYSALLFHRLMGTGVLATSTDGAPYLRAYSHCSRITTGITLLLINLCNSTTFNINVADNLDSSMGSTQGERWEYHLSPQGGDLQNNTVLLNGTPLEVNSTANIPPMNPNITYDPNPLTVAPSTIVFVVLPDFEAPACG